MDSIHNVIEYSNMSYTDVLNLPVDIFMLMNKKYIIDKLMRTEEGREYLDDCKRLTTTKCDIKSLRKKFMGKGEK